ncbi:MAG TPA: nuclear transport factor 2 family protein [archaeon]|nr:nuclear transport factor 2 family protein [archaeon]
MQNRSFVLIIILCAIPLAAFAQPAPPKPLAPLVQTLTAAEHTFIDAAKKGDAAFFQRTLTDDFSYVSFDGQLYDRQQMIDERSDPGFDILPYNMTVVPAGDAAAIVTYDVVLRVPSVEDQGPPPRYQHFTTVWVKQGDAWKMKFQQMSVSHWGDW